VHGEGIFLDLNRERLEAWETNPLVIERVGKVNENYARRFREIGKTPDRVVSPRLILVHTLAHALINQWALDSGYPAASLRERLFVGSRAHWFIKACAS